MSKLSFTLFSMAAIGAISLAACGETGNGPIVVASGGTAPGVGGGALPTGGTDPVGSGGAGAGTSVGGAGAGTSVGGSGADTSAGGTVAVEGVPLSFTDGWLAADANTLAIQGAVFAYADVHTEAGNPGDAAATPPVPATPAMTTAIEGPTACIAGEAFKVDKACEDIPGFMFTPPAEDCYGEYWGAAIGFNLNQPSIPDPENEGEEIGGDPLPFDATGKIKAFSFTLTGATIPSSMRFAVDVGDGETNTQYCTTSKTKIVPDANGLVTVNLDDLRSECWLTTAFDDATNRPDVSKIVKIAWAVVTSDSKTTPFDYCVGNVIAVP